MWKFHKCIITHADNFLPQGIKVPKGSELTLLVSLVQRDEKWFPNPLEFDPDRFDPDHGNKHHQFAYLPFSAGSRNCMGQGGRPDYSAHPKLSILETEYKYLSKGDLHCRIRKSNQG